MKCSYYICHGICITDFIKVRAFFPSEQVFVRTMFIAGVISPSCEGNVCEPASWETVRRSVCFCSPSGEGVTIRMVT